MKSPEDHIDDGLRDALKRRFDDFEIKPDPSLKTNIFEALKVWQQDKNFQRIWIIFLTLAILFTGTLFYRSTRNSVAQKVPRSGETNVKHLPLAARPSSYVVKPPVKAIYESGNTAAKPAKVISENKVLRSIKKASTDFEQAVDPVAEFPGTEHVDASEITKNEIVVTRSEAFVEKDFALLDNLPPHFNGTEMKVPDPAAPDSSYFTKKNTAYRGWTILAGVTPVKTFQVLNVISNPGFIYQNFRFPKSASLETLGYKLNAGIARNGFEFLVSYSQYRQSVRFEKAGDEFEIVPGGANDAHVRRKFTAVNSDRTLRLVGIGVRKQFIPRAPAFRDFYAVIGSEFSRELTMGKNMAWLNAGIGRQVAISKTATLQVGPYFEYGFTRLLSKEGSFQVKPYQVGLSVILKNRLMK